VERDRALALLARLHEAQGSFYAGGPDGPLRAVLADDIVWHVPGSNAIAGVYEGVEAVLAYMRRRRDLADATFRMHPGDVLVGEGDRVSACWLLPLDVDAFDAAWRTAAG
jgi:SnoaL-like protein